jgi:hypothetical protein
MRALVEPGVPNPVNVPIPVPPIPPIPLPPNFFGTRVLIYKQDPSVGEIGVRKSFLPGIVLAGPRDARITSGSPGIAPVTPNVFGDFIQTPNTDAFDAVHTYAVVRQTLTMYKRALAVGGSAAPLPWQWNTAANTDPLNMLPPSRGIMLNAFYSRNKPPSGSATSSKWYDQQDLHVPLIRHRGPRDRSRDPRWPQAELDRVGKTPDRGLA